MADTVYFMSSDGLRMIRDAQCQALDKHMGIVKAVDKASEAWIKQRYGRTSGKSVAEEYIGHFRKIPIYGRNIKFSIVHDPLNFQCRHEKTEKLIKQAVKDMIEAKRKND